MTKSAKLTKDQQDQLADACDLLVGARRRLQEDDLCEINPEVFAAWQHIATARQKLRAILDRTPTTPKGE